MKEKVIDLQTEIIRQVRKERLNQDLKWGQQNHCPKVWSLILGEEVGEMNRAIIDASIFHKGKLLSIQREKLTEGKGCYREELIQIAAVAIAMVECLDRNEW